MVALSVVAMLLSYFPYLTYTVPAVTGLFMMVLVIELDKKWAILAYIASSLIILFIAEPESKLLYVCLFGYYPILKSVIERINKLFIEWLLKIIVFNASVLVAYLLFSKVFNISLDDFNEFGRIGIYIFMLIANITFVLYDIAISRMAMLYMRVLHNKIEKIFKIGR